MAEALAADGEKLRQLTGEDHGPWDVAALDEAEYLGEIGHWIAAPMKDVGTLDQFHEVCHRAAQVIGPLRDLLSRTLPDLEIAANAHRSDVLLREVRAELERKTCDPCG
jgi:hypothetical protein